MAVVYLFSVVVGILVMVLQCRCVEPVVVCPAFKPAESGLNIAYLTVNREGVDSTVVLQLVSAECYTCKLQNVSVIKKDNQNCSVTVDTRWPVRIAIVSDSPIEGCSELDYKFEENGNYIIYVIKINNTITCQTPVRTGSDPDDSNLAVYGTLGIFAGLALIWICIQKSRRKFIRLLYVIRPSAVDTEAFAEQDLGTPTNALRETGSSASKERLKSLDTLRGISLVIMMFVNYGGGDYWFFNHSKWNGLTVADLVFPWFIWIMGTAMMFSFKSLAKQKVGRGTIFLKIFRRSLTLFALGFLVSSGGSHNFDNWRLLGVLQRFALTYLVTATIHMFFMNAWEANTSGKWRNLRDVINYWKEWIVHILIVIIHTCLTFLLTVPGCPTGYLGPGGLANDGPEGYDVTNCTGGAAGYIDRQIVGDTLLYKSPTCAEIYKTTVPYDPEGLLGVLTCCFLCFLGLQSGKILAMYPDTKSRVKRFIIWAVITGSISAILCKASKNDGWIPINKNLWSLSYVLAMASMAFTLLTFCYMTVDHWKIWTGAPFYYPGMNSIVVYTCHEVFSRPFMNFWDIEPYSHAIFMLINVVDVSFWVLMSFYLYHKKIFISV